jgi:hypothetical protein
MSALKNADWAVHEHCRGSAYSKQQLTSGNASKVQNSVAEAEMWFIGLLKRETEAFNENDNCYLCSQLIVSLLHTDHTTCFGYTAIFRCVTCIKMLKIVIII